MTEQITSATAHIAFEITRWDSVPYDEGAAGPALAQVAVDKAFSGDLTGTSVARLLTCTVEGREGAGYVASERVTGTLAGRSGTFVLQHGGIAGGGATPRSFGSVVPDSATGGLAGLLGECEFQHDDQGARLTLTYRFAG